MLSLRMLACRVMLQVSKLLEGLVRAVACFLDVNRVCWCRVSGCVRKCDKLTRLFGEKGAGNRWLM